MMIIDFPEPYFGMVTLEIIGYDVIPCTEFSGALFLDYL